MKTVEEIKARLLSLKKEAEERLNEIPEEFNDLQDSKNYNYFTGALIAVNNILEFIGE